MVHCGKGVLCWRLVPRETGAIKRACKLHTGAPHPSPQCIKMALDVPSLPLQADVQCGGVGDMQAFAPF